jgi:DNA-binding LacI/PurR family transcriptional regulator
MLFWLLTLFLRVCILIIESQLISQEVEVKEYEKIERLIIAEIENGHIQGVMPSERKLALRYGTSRINIKQATKRLLERKIIYSISPRRLAVAEADKRTKKIALFSFLKTDWRKLQSPIFRDSISSVIENVPKDYEFNFYGGTVEDEADILRQMITDKVDGIISIPHAIGYYLNNIELYSELQKNGCKIVFLLRNIKEVISTSVLPDEMFLIERAVKALKEKGCKHIVLIEREKSWMGNYRRNIFKFRYYKDNYCHHIDSNDIDYRITNDLREVTVDIENKLEQLNIPEDEKVGFLCMCGDQWVLPLWDIFRRQGRTDFHVVSEGQIRGTLQEEFNRKSIPEDIFVNRTIDFKGAKMGTTAIKHLIALIESNSVYSNTILVKPDIIL